MFSNPHLRRFTGYTVLAAVGLGLDFTVFGVICYGLSVAPFWANIAGNLVGASWLYFSTGQRLFRYKGALLLPKLVAYWAWTLALMLLVSSLIAAAYQMLGIDPGLVKLALTGFSFVLNYYVLSWLMRCFEPR